MLLGGIVSDDQVGANLVGGEFVSAGVVARVATSRVRPARERGVLFLLSFCVVC